MKKVNKDLICLGLTVYAGAASMLGAVPDSIGQPWDFNRCLEYAYENNISLQQKQLDKASSDATLLASKAMWQPTLDFSTTQGLTNYPSPADNSDHNLYAGTYGLNASWIVFNGNIRRNQIKQDELQQQIAELGIDDYRYTLQTEILAKYLNIPERTCRSSDEFGQDVARRLLANRVAVSHGPLQSDFGGIVVRLGKNGIEKAAGTRHNNGFRHRLSGFQR